MVTWYEHWTEMRLRCVLCMVRRLSTRDVLAHVFCGLGMIKEFAQYEQPESVKIGKCYAVKYAGNVVSSPPSPSALLLSLLVSSEKEKGVQVKSSLVCYVAMQTNGIAPRLSPPAMK